MRAMFCQVDVVAARLDPADPTLAAFGGGEDVVCAATSSRRAEPFLFCVRSFHRLRGQGHRCCGILACPAFQLELFRAYGLLV